MISTGTVFPLPWTSAIPSCDFFMIAIPSDFTAEFIGHLKLNNSVAERQRYSDSFVVRELSSVVNYVLKHSPGGKDGMASGPPKVPRRAQYDKLSVDRGTVVTLLCEAQAFPIPSFRLVAGAP